MTTTRGTICRIVDHGTIVMVTIAQTDAQATAGVGFDVPFDHTPFRWIVEGETDGDVRQLIGREVETDGEAFHFLDERSDVTHCDTVGCDKPVTIPEGSEDEAYCESCQEIKDCADEGHCGHSDCRHHNVCCACSDEGLDFTGPTSEYDTNRERDFDRETDAINEARWEREGI